MAAALDLTSRASIARGAARHGRCAFGGLDIVDQHRGDLSDAGPPGTPAEDVWAQALHDQRDAATTCWRRKRRRCCKAQSLPASIVLTSSANAVVPKHGSEPYDVSKAAINHLIRELAVGLGPLVRVNGIAPATVVAGSAMFPRDRVIVVAAEVRDRVRRAESTEELRGEAGGVLRAADDHAAADPADRLRERDLLAGRRPEREDDGPRDSGRRRAAGGVPAVDRSRGRAVTRHADSNSFSCDFEPSASDLAREARSQSKARDVPRSASADRSDRCGRRSPA